MNPKHIYQVAEKDDRGIKRKATAPYNFIELPTKVVDITPESLPDQNRYYLKYDNRYTGNIKCILTTEKPFYIRCGLTTTEFQDEKEAKDLPEFFYTVPEAKSEKPVIPGSSLRGMLRTLVEIVSFSKIERVTQNKLFYRSLGDPALKDIYGLNFVEKHKVPHPHNSNKQIDCYQSKVHSGFLRKQGISYIIEECGYGRIDSQIDPNTKKRIFQFISNSQIYLGHGPGKTPNWDYQHKTIYVQIDSQAQDYFFPLQRNRNGKERHPDLCLRYRAVQSASFNETPGYQPATLVITGDMQQKHLEFVFLHEAEPIRTYKISEEDIIRRFQDDDQLTQWQENAYKKDKPSPNCRQKDGFLRDGEPVFFLLNEDETTVRFLGRAQMFRLPYNLSPFELVPELLRDPSVTDIAEAIFGYVGGKNRDSARAGRVFVEDATCISNGNVWWKGDFEKTVTPKILASPKPTTFQHYLVQTSTDRKQLKHYSPQSDEDKTVIRGHKLYWHKQNVGSEEIEERDREKIEKARSQYTDIKPIKAGVSFDFSIHFENLSDVELGALLRVLKIAADPKYCLSLGMGKPLGMGAVKIQHQLCLSDRQQRYKNLFDGNQWETAERVDSGTEHTNCVKAFEKYILARISEDDHPKGGKATALEQLPRIEMLLAMLRCENPPAADDTRYMTIDAKEYVDRPVLPTPFQLIDMPDTRRHKTASPSSVSTETKRVNEMPKKKTEPVKKNPQKDSQEGHSEGGSGINLATQRPPRPPKRPQ